VSCCRCADFVILNKADQLNSELLMESLVTITKALNPLAKVGDQFFPHDSVCMLYYHRMVYADDFIP
jgi:hypothetical protein